MSDAAAVPAATVLLLRAGTDGPETLLVRRGRGLAFHGGAWVFPGGRVEIEDGAGGGDDLAAARAAGVRELREEAGVVLAAEELVPVSHWTTPPGQVRRFATWFFAAEVDDAATVVVDGDETISHRWIRPADALAARDRGELELPPPTFVTLAIMQDVPSPAAAIELLTAGGPSVFVPRMHRVEDGALSLYAGDAGYESGALDAPGARHRLHMLQDGWRYERSAG